MPISCMLPLRHWAHRWAHVRRRDVRGQSESTRDSRLNHAHELASIRGSGEARVRGRTRERLVAQVKCGGCTRSRAGMRHVRRRRPSALTRRCTTATRYSVRRRRPTACSWWCARWRTNPGERTSVRRRSVRNESGGLRLGVYRNRTGLGRYWCRCRCRCRGTTNRYRCRYHRYRLPVPVPRAPGTSGTSASKYRCDPSVIDPAVLCLSRSRGAIASAFSGVRSPGVCG